MNTEYMKTLFQTNSDQINNIARQGIFVLVVALACWLIAKVFRRAIEKTNERVEKFDETLVPILSKTGTAVVYSLGIVMILDRFGVNTAGLLAVMGAAGIAVAFALKDTLSNIAAGIMLLLLRPFRKGHFIEAGPSVGTVKEIGLFTTVLETPDGMYISAPNSSLWGTPIKNITRNGKRRMDVIVGISYSDSIEKGFEALRSVIREEKRFLEEPEPKVMVQAMADSSVNLQLRAWASVDDYWNVYWDTNRKMKESIEAAGLTIPFPQRDVHHFNEKEAK